MKTGYCSRCGQNLRLVQSFPEEYNPVSIKDGLELCPQCYRNMEREELELYFK